MFDSIKRALRDALDVFKRARNLREVLRALLPARMQKRMVLNLEADAGEVMDSGELPSAPADELAVELRRLRNRLQGEAVDSAGRVAYEGLGETETFAQLRASAQRLRGVSASDFADDNERHAFWINLYNVLAIHGVISLNIQTSVMEIPSFFARVAYQIGRYTFTLDDIENGVLRRNAPHPATGARPFGKADERLDFCVETIDPRIHAALVCASESCPPVSFYDAERVDEQLGLAAANYVASEVLLDEQQVLLPITFRYYAMDFGDGPDSIWDFLLEQAQGEQRQALTVARAAGFGFAYRRYDWSLNQTAP